MAFIDEVRRLMEEKLARKIQAAEAGLKTHDDGKKRSVEDAATAKLDLLMLKRTPVNPGAPDRTAQINALEAKIKDARESYAKIEREQETHRSEIRTCHDIKADMQKNALQLTA